MDRRFRLALVGAGMFGGDVHLRTYADLVRCGIAPYLGRIGMDDFAREFADVQFELVAIGTRTEASAQRAAHQFHAWTGTAPRPFFGETPWEAILDAFPDLNLLAIATPDPLHGPPMHAALERGVHVIVEKPMTLDLAEADRALELAQRNGCLIGLDMHKRYDPDHIKIFRELLPQMGHPLYARAVLEEPLEVSTKTFKWVTQSDPFSYVGVHWTDLFVYYLDVKPVALFAVGQKQKLLHEYGIDAYDAVQVDVVFDNGLHAQFLNHWITPPEFEGPVNQECEIVATGGKIESDSQYRGLRYVREGDGSRTANTHFTRQVARPDGSEVTVGYGKDSLIACLLAALRRVFREESPEVLQDTYPNGEEGRISVAILAAAAAVRDRNAEHLAAGNGAPATAAFTDEGILLHDPIRGSEKLYGRPV